jgi:DNA polymerase-3 subunit delta'
MNFSGFSEKMEFSPVFDSATLLHSYFVWGEDTPDRERAANTLAAAMVCSSGGMSPCGVCEHCRKAKKGVHPDIIVIAPPADKKEISAETARFISADAYISPNEAERKVYIIKNAGALPPVCQNILLKTLEEPPGQSCFIIVGNSPSELLETVLSRCGEIRVAGSEAGFSSDTQEYVDGFFAALQGGNLKLAEFLAGLDGMDKIQFTEFLGSLRAAAIERLKKCALGESQLSEDKLMHLISALADAAGMAAVNVNTGHITGRLFAELITVPTP